MEKGNYMKFLLMLAVSFVIMYGVMYLNADKFDHVYLNLNRLYMALLMVAPMALVMLGFMSGMYTNKKLKYHCSCWCSSFCRLTVHAKETGLSG
ncbi:hypothetical protein C8E01_10171 [Pontibacter virosus]|uniref:Uncharacterized protein n=1 Tax=Pontibacter virosus TaxID=1765052 RepID=A0A2U1B4W0_9BACT|nr:hypothetical protein C8E01_10171 [Pontibacter virosus]